MAAAATTAATIDKKSKTGAEFSAPVLFGIYLSNIFQTKGLEFDRIIMPFMNYSESYDNDPIHYNNLLYVAFSRARNNLDIYYQDKPHQVLLNHYSDYLLNQRKTT